MELARPGLQADERLPLERQEVRPAELASADHRSLLEHADVLVDRRQRQTAELRQVADRPGLKRKEQDDLAPVLIRQGVEHPTQVVHDRR